MTEKFIKNMECVRKLMAVLRDEKYAIVNPDITMLDEYTKNLYLKVLCTVLQYGNEPTEMQLLFLKRMVKGIGVEESAEEHMRKALEISDTDIREFLTLMKGNKIKYYFALEGLLLAAMGEASQDCYTYLAELLELSGINRDDLECICLVANSALQQDSSYYDAAKDLKNERFQEVDYAPYISSFYCGAVKDTREIVHYLAADRKYSKNIEVRTHFTERKVVFENLDITVNEEWNFSNCESVIFSNCSFTGKKYSLKMQGCQKVDIRKCRFEGFRAPVLVEEECMAVQITKCEFEDCNYYYSNSNDHWSYHYSVGGVIHTVLQRKDDTIRISESSFIDCGSRNSRWIPAAPEGVISNRLCEVSECRFYNCWNIRPKYKYSGDDGEKEKNGKLFIEETKGSNNELINSAPFC